MTSQPPPIHAPLTAGPPRGQGYLSWLVLVVGALASLAVGWYVPALERGRQTGEFQRRASTLGQTVEREINASLAGLEDFAQHLTLTPSVDRQGFLAYGASIMARNAGVHLVAYLPRVSGPERLASEARVATEGAPGFVIRQLDQQNRLVPAPARDEYYPALHVLGGERVKAQELVASLDMATVPQAAQAMAGAAASGQGVATGRQRLPHLPVDRPYCVMVFLPVFQPGGGQPPPAQRRPRGYLLGMLTLSDLVDISRLHAASAKANLLLEDQSDSGQDRLSYRQEEPGPQPREGGLPPELVHTHKFEAAGRQWAVTVTPSRAFLDEARAWPGAAMGGGLLLLTMLGTLLQRQWQTRARQAQDLAQERSRQLEQALGQAGQIFQMVPTPIYTVDLDRKVTSVNRRFEEVTGYAAHEVLGRSCQVFALDPCSQDCGLLDPSQDKPMENRRCATGHQERRSAARRAGNRGGRPGGFAGHQRPGPRHGRA